MKNLKLILAILSLYACSLFGQSTTSSYTKTLKFFSSDLLQIYEGARIAVPTMTLPNSLTTYTSTLPFGNSDNRQVYNAIRGMGDAVSSLTATSWQLNGNALGLNTAFIGSTDNRSLIFKTNNLERGKFDSLGLFDWRINSTGYHNRIALRTYATFTDIPAMYMAIGRGSENGTNYAVLGDGTNNVFNAPSGFFARTNNTTFLSAYTQYTANGNIIQINGITVPTVASNNAINSVRFLGNTLTFSVGTTSEQRNVLISNDTYAALTTATISDASGLDVVQPTTGSGMTITRKWAARFTGAGIFSTSLTVGASITTSAPSNFYCVGTSSTAGIMRAESGIGVGADPSSTNFLNASATVAGRYGILITNASAGVSAHSAIRFGNNSNQSTIGQAGTGATVGNGLYALALNFNQDDPGGFAFGQQGSATSGAYTRFRIWGIGNYSNQTASTEIPSFINSSFTRGWATGNFALQREVLFSSITYSAVGASVIDKAVGMQIEAPTASTNVTITRPYALGLTGGLEITSTTQGVLFPRMTTAQKNAIGSPMAGLVVYDTTLNKLCVYTGGAWETITSL